jgi:predicted permease
MKNPMKTLAADLRFVARTLAKSPWFVLVITVTLALGVGVNTAMFSVVNAILLRPLPVPNPEQLVVLAEQVKDVPGFSGISYPDYRDFQDQSNMPADLAAYQLSVVGLSSGGKASTAVVQYVSGNFFSMMSVQPEIGRLIAPNEGGRPGADPVVVLSDAYWRKHFQADKEIIGKAVTVNGRGLTVIGVAEEKFSGPSVLVATDAYIPLSIAGISLQSDQFWTKRDQRRLKVLGRLRQHMSLETAQAALRVVAERLAREYPSTNGGLAVRLFPERLARPEPGDSGLLPIVGLLFLLLAGMVLMVACVNVVNLWLVRALARQKELATRSALGATRARLIQQTLTESMALALLGGTAGVFLGKFACAMLESVRNHVDVPLYLNFTFDWRVFTYALTLALLTGIVVGVTPALRAAKVNVSEVLNQGGRSGSAGKWHNRLRAVLVVGQIATSLVLLLTAGLFLRSLQAAQRMDLGFAPDRLLNITMDPRQLGYDEARGKAFYLELESRIYELPGVESASLSFSTPFGFVHESADVYIEKRPVDKNTRPPEVFYNTVDVPYFDNLKIPLVQGRLFAESDNQNAPLVAVVNQTMAKRYWPNEDAIGKRFALGNATGPYLQVIGITRDGKYLGPSDDAEPYFFRPVNQQYVSVRTLQVRTTVAQDAMLPRIQKLISSLAPDLPLIELRTMNDALNGLNGFFAFRLAAGLAAGLGLLGLLLAVVGVYGIVSYSVGQRTKEIGIRMAMGAQRSDILSMILKQGLGLVMVGIVTGLLCAFAVSNTIKSLLVGINANDPVTFGATSAGLAFVVVVASLIPALRALRISPIINLRRD